MKKRLLSICLVLALCLTCVPSALAVGDVRFSGGDGTENTPYEISTADDLFALADAVNNGMSYEGEYFSLTNDINLDGQAWTPIGDRLNQDEFLGTFDGNNRTVSGLCVEGAYGSAGLFGFVGMSSWNTTAEVKNLNVVGSVSVERTPATFYVAGIAGFVGQGAEITNCSFEGTITATIKSGQSGQGKNPTVLIVGGIAGYNFGTISECTVLNSDISGKNQSTTAGGAVYVAGIVAANNTGGTIKSCTVENSTITGTNENKASQNLVGGIAADNIVGTIEDCKVINGSVSTSGSMEVSSVGGIAGCSDGTLKDCSNSSSVEGTNILKDPENVPGFGSGGVVGCNKHLVERCSNTGSVTGHGSFTGGVVGYNTTNNTTDGTISFSYNTGAVEGKQYVGGVVGNNHTVVEDCYNTGQVTSTGDYVGGVVGRNTYYFYFIDSIPSYSSMKEWKGKISTSYNTGAVSGGSYVGGVAGYNCVTIAQCFNTGSVTGSKNYTGGVVGCNAYYIDDRYGRDGVVKEYPGETQNTYNAGAVTGVNYVGGVVGEQQGGEVEGQKKGSCKYSHNYGAVSSSGQGTNIGGVFGHLEANASANVCYYLNTSASSVGVSGSTTVTNVDSKTSDQFASGEVAFLLDKPNTDSHVWGQEIGTDKYPVFTDDPLKNVLQVTFENTVDTPATTQYAYANPNGTVDVPENTDTVPSGKVYCWVDASHTRYTDATHILFDVTLTPVLAYTIDYAADTAVAAAGHKISTDGATWHDDVSIEPGQTLFVNHPDDQKTEETLPSRPASPGTVRGGTNQITGVTAAMEYRLSGASTWTACTGTAITGLPAGEYQVRIKATSTSFASEPVTVQVSQYTPPVVPTYPPTVEEPENGTVTTSPSRPKEGDRVTITPKPDEGFEVDEVVVEDADGNEIKVTQNQDGTYSFTQPDGKVTITVTFRCDGGELCPSDHLTDVEEDGWYHDAVDYVVEHGIMEGMSPTTFAPRRELTRAEVVQVLYNLEGRPDVTGENIFTDTAKHWAVDPITWAATTGVVDGYGDDTFRPNNPVSRQEFAQMLYRYAKYKGYDLAAEGDLSQFPDSGKIGEWAEVAMKWANGEGLIQGHENGTIDPTGTTIRAQAASILMRFDLNLVQQ